jgi:hypothetical protein
MRASTFGASFIRSMTRLLQGFKALRLAAAGVILAINGSAFADDCGPLRVPGYIAQRTLVTPSGTITSRVTVTSRFERSETQNPKGPPIVQVTDLEKRTIAVVNPAGKVAVSRTPTMQLSKNNREASYVNRVAAASGLSQVEVGLKTPQGNEWISRSTCRSDGIFVSKEVKVPSRQGQPAAVRITQSDIQITTVPPSAFQVKPNAPTR